MKEISKQLDKDLSKVFFNSVEELNEFYGTSAKLPTNLRIDTDFVCYEIVEPFTLEDVCQYKFGEGGLNYSLGSYWSKDLRIADSELSLHKYDCDEYNGRCFVYVRVNDYLRKHIEKNLIGCEFASKSGKKNLVYRMFVGEVQDSLMLKDQVGYHTPLKDALFYPDDNSDPIPYREWIKLINKNNIEGDV